MQGIDVSKSYRRGLRTWFDLSLATKGMIVISIPLVCILCSVSALFIFQQQRANLNLWIARAFQAGARIQATITLLTDAESETRGFLLTGDAHYREAYQRAQSRLPGTFAGLRKALADSPSQLERIGKVEALSRQRMATMGFLLSQPRSSERSYQLENDRMVMDSIQQEFAAMRGDETKRWVARIAAETKLRNNLSVTLYAAALLSLLAGGFAMALFTTGIVQRAQLLRLNAERLVRGEALMDLPPGADEIGQLGEALARSSHLLSERDSEMQNINQNLDRRVSERTAELEASKEDLRLAKEVAEAASHGMQETSERLNLALSASRTGVWSWDVVNDHVVWDEYIYEIFGFSPGSFGGTMADLAATVHPDDRDVMTGSIRKASEGRNELVVEFRVIWPDASVHNVVSRGKAFHDKGRLTRMTGVSQDITGQRQLEEQFRQAQKMDAVGQLAGGIAHDFNNMLNVIIGYSRLLLLSLKPQDPAYRQADEIRRAGEGAAALTQQLLAFSRKQVLQPQVLNLAEILIGMDQMVRRTIGEHIEIVTRADENLAQVRIDPSQMQQVLLNLVVNARDAMPQGGKLALELENMEVNASSGRVHGIPAGQYVMLSVSDTGSGMTPEVQRRVFEPFFTTKEVGRGTGLGLATVYGIVKQSGGHIWLYSEPEIGTTFKIFFPRVDELGESMLSESLQNLAGGEETILVVEDDPGLRALAREVLSSVGYNVLVAGNGEEAFHVSEQYAGQIHMLLTDFVMPKMSGKEVASRLVVSRPEMKVLFMSGYTGNALSQHGTLDPVVDFIQKPWTPEGLCEKIRIVLTTRSSIQRILVVDDEPGIRNWFAEILQGAGYCVFLAQHGREARAKAKEHPVDLVITDLAMPEEEGLEMIQAIRKEHPQLKIIVMSGAFGRNMLKMAELFGARAALTKPLTSEKVLQCVHNLLQARPPLQKTRRHEISTHALILSKEHVAELG